MTDIVPPSPGVGARRTKKAVPQLPRSAFSPPTSSAEDKFPLSDPSAIHPKTVIDASVSLKTFSGDIAKWKQTTGDVLGPLVNGVVLAVDSVDAVPKDVPFPIISLVLPLPQGAIPAAKGTNPIAYSLSFTGPPGPEVLETVKAAFKAGHVLEIDVRSDLRTDAGWEQLEEFIGHAIDFPEPLEKTPTVVFTNVLPPPHGLEFSTIKLLNHPTYLSYGSHSSTVSFFPRTFIKFTAPSWDAPTPKSPTKAEAATEDEPGVLDSEEKKEWKRRVRMYLGPVVEAFGFSRILFGSSPSASSRSPSNANDWYQLAREAVAELGVDQEGIDEVFGANAKEVYGA